MPRPKLSTLSTIMPPKGAAVRPEPSEQSDMQDIEQASGKASMQPNKQSSIQPSSQDYKEGPRTAVSFRMTMQLQDRLREYAHRERRTKQDILDDALHEFLSRAGF